MRVIGGISVILFALLTSFLSLEAQQTPGEILPVRQITLDNGMRLVILKRPGPPTISFTVQFNVGGVNERLGTTGIAHLLEHMLFKGTTSVGTKNLEAELELYPWMDSAHDSLVEVRASGDSVRTLELSERIAQLEDSAAVFIESNEFDHILTRAGARGLNATTTNESTVYFVDLPANRAELWFALEADRMVNPVFREFYSERDVVAEERRMRVEMNPVGALTETHLASAFSVHPYGVPVVGYMADLQVMSRQNVERYYRLYYGPNNAIVGIVGDLDPDQIEAWAREYFAPIPRAELPPAVTAVEPPQEVERRTELEFDAQPQLQISWHVPAGTDPDAPSLAILSSMLTGGRTSRLYRRLVLESRVATSVFSSLGPGMRYPQLLQISATPRAPHTTMQIEELIYEELELLIQEGPSDSELQRVRNQISAGTVRRIQSNIGLAFQLVESVALFNDWRETFRYSNKLRAVTADDVIRIAETYLNQSNRTVTTLVKTEYPG